MARRTKPTAGEPRKGEGSRVRDLERRLAEALKREAAALDQRTATSEILRVIATSPTDLQPVLDSLVVSAGRLCEAADTFLLLVERDQLKTVAAHGPGGNPDLSYSINRGWVTGRAVMDMRVVHVEDLASAGAEFPLGVEIAARFGHRTALALPLLRQGVAIGALFLRRREVRKFSDEEIALLQTFADQAVIAIENVRLFTELQEKNTALTAAHAQVTESLERQTATAEILRVISSSPTDTQPVFDAIARNAVALCGGISALVLRFDGEMLHVAGYHAMNPQGVALNERAFPRRPGRDYPPGRAFLDRNVVHVPDLQAATEFAASTARQRGAGSQLAVPLLHEGEAIGVIGLARDAVGPFSPQQIEMLRTFAAQAVIAIENVRLFKELQEKNGALTKALEQQTATSEILQTIAQAPTDVQPVFDTIVRSAAQLCRAHTAAVFLTLTDGQLVHHPASYGDAPEALAAIKARFPRPLDRETAAGTAILTRSVMHVPDVEAPSTVEFARQTGRVVGFRSLLSVPMLRQGEAVGAINVTRREPGSFSDAEVALLQTFADQAVIAIENVRLFKELEAANRELAGASQHKSEFLANMSHELRTPLNAIIGFSEVLSERMFGELNEKQEEYLKDIYASGTHLLSLINDILDLSKIEAGRMELELADFHLPQAIENALTLVRERAGRRGIALAHTMDERLGEIRGDERKVKQVLLNLLSNALKFTPEGGRIEVRAGMMDGMVEIGVTDTGVGIAPEDQETVFEEFRQVGTAEKKAEGTGLGLTLCRKFVELHGGRIWVKSQLGAGSTFTFTIPVRHGE